MKIKSLVSASVVALSAVARAFTPGTWETSFADGKAYADSNHAPMVVVWGNQSCKYCNTLAEVLDDPVILNWAAKHPIAMVLKHDVYQRDERQWTKDYKAAREWINALDDHTAKSNPHVGIYWKKSDGTEVVSWDFSGRDGMMPVTAGSLAGQFVGTLDKYFGSYTGGDVPTPVPAGDWTTAEFAVSGEGIDRLEAEPSTFETYVPLVRGETAARKAGKVRLVVRTPGSNKVSSEQEVVWKSGEDRKNVRIAVPKGTKGRKTAVDVIGAGEEILDTTFIYHVADQKNAASNPHFVGDYAPASLPYGEWTLDFEAAKEKVATVGGYILAMFSGPLWCPHCIGMEDSLLSSSKFKSWAKQNKVALVLFDQPVNGQLGPRLLTYDFYYTGSGAAYLSRHGIDPDGADAVDACADQAKYTLEWRTADDIAYAARPRLGNPTVLLLDRTGTRVAARFTSIESADSSFDPTENVARLKELLKLAERDECDDFATTTTLTLEPGESASAEFQINCRNRFYRLSGFNAAAAKFKATGAKDVNLYLVKDNEVLAQGVNTLVVDLKKTPIRAGALLKVEAYGDAGGVKYGSKATAFSVALTAEQGDEEMMRTVALDEVTKSEALSLNGGLYATKTYVVPLRTATAGGSVAAGTLTVKQTTRNKLTATYAGTEKASLKLTGAWQEINLLTGVATATLEKNGAMFMLALGADGALAAEVLLPEGYSAFGAELLGAAGAALSKTEAAVFAGLYTVTLPDAAGEVGTATASLNVSKSGKASWSTYLPNGTKVGGTASLTANVDGTASLALYKRGTSDFFAAELVIKPNAAQTWGDEGKMDTVSAAAGVKPCHLYRKGAVETQTLFDVYGGYFKKSTPLEICELFDLSPVLAVVVRGEKIAEVTATKSGFKFTRGGALTSFSYSKSTGAFTGRAKIDGVTQNIKGILLPGWIDCHCGDPVVERPYGSGMIYTKTGSLPLDLIATAK